MYPITTMYPEDPRQPFYDPTSSEMTPLARLYIRKVKQYARNCDDNFLQAQVLDVAENVESDGPQNRMRTPEITQRLRLTYFRLQLIVRRTRLASGRRAR